MQIPTRIEQAVGEAVARHLESELADRGLLITADGLAAAEATAMQQGVQLMTSVMQRCFPITRSGLTTELVFEGDEREGRIVAALAFGAQAARLLSLRTRERHPAGLIELLCAMFNLGIGLVDGLCDEDAELGVTFINLLHRQDLLQAAEEPKGRSWLRAALPRTLMQDHTVSFAVDIIETFFDTFHELYPGRAWVQYRRGVGKQLKAALEAERRSVTTSADGTSVEQLTACSRLTSVIPFQVIEALAGGKHAASEKTAGTLFGEAMWRIDDLVDLCEDACSGALNGVLLAATEEPADAARDPAAVLERLLASTHIACAAAEAAEDLLAGLRLAAPAGGPGSANHQSSRVFLYFIQRYAGISPRPKSSVSDGR